VNSSEVDFVVEPVAEKAQHGAIRYSLAALKNVGASAVQTIVDARKEGGPFTSLGDVAARLDAKAMNKRSIENLAQAGAFDMLGENRATVKANAEQIIAMAQRVSADQSAGTSDLFAAGGEAPSLILRNAKAWTPLEQLENEFSSVGFYLSGHPLDQYQKVLSKVGATKYANLEAAAAQGTCAGKIGAIVVSVRERRSARGNKFAFAMFSDTSGQFEAVMFSDTLAAAGDLLEAGTAVVLTVSAESDDEGTVKLRVQIVEALDRVAANVERGLRIHCDAGVTQSKGQVFDELKGYLMAPAAGTRGGEIRLVLSVDHRGRELELKLPGKYDVSPKTAGNLSTIVGVNCVEET
jgi:DNA polymerase-3 subunit alpha